MVANHNFLSIIQLWRLLLVQGSLTLVFIMYLAVIIERRKRKYTRKKTNRQVSKNDVIKTKIHVGKGARGKTRK